MVDKEATLTIVVDDPDLVLTAFNVIKIERSITGSVGPFFALTKNAPAAAGTLLGSQLEPFFVSGQILQLILDEGTQVDVLFTGTDPLTASGVVSQLNTALGGAVATNEGGRIRLTSTILGTDSKVEIVGGTALNELGFIAGQRDIGEDVHIPVISGTTIYTYIDEDGQAGYWYRTRYRNTTSGVESLPSAPFQAGPSSPLDPANLCLVSIDLVDASGLVRVGQRIVFYPITPTLESTSPPNIGIALGRKPIIMVTNEVGHAETSLARGLQVRVVFEGTSLVRDIVVPNAVTLDLLAAIASAPDIFNVFEQVLPAAPRRTI